MSVSKKQIVWANVAKFLAMFAVIVDHCYGVFYFDERIQRITCFSTSLFVLIQGYTSYYSYVNDKDNYLIKSFKRILSILLHYFIASFIVYFIKYRYIDIVFLSRLLHFKVEGPYYYIFLYIQMCLCTIPLLSLINKNSIIRMMVFIGVLIITYFSMKEKVFDISLGGGFIFGGTYFPLLYCGIELGKNDTTIKGYINKLIKKSLIIVFFFLLISMLIIYRNHFEIDIMLFGSVFYNPPNLSISIYSIIVMMFVYVFVEYLEQTRIKQVGLIVNALNYIGKHTLYMFLYHNILITIIVKVIPLLKLYAGVLTTTLVCLLIMILSIAIEYLSKLIIGYTSRIVRKVIEIN